jgi:hypothetical protein
MKSRNEVAVGSNPWTALIWLLMGPLPLIMVLTFQTRRVPVDLNSREDGRPAAMLTAAPPRLAGAMQVSQVPAKRDSAKRAKVTRKTTATRDVSKTRS